MHYEQWIFAILKTESKGSNERDIYLENVMNREGMKSDDERIYVIYCQFRQVLCHHIGNETLSHRLCFAHILIACWRLVFLPAFMMSAEEQ